MRSRRARRAPSPRRGRRARAVERRCAIVITVRPRASTDERVLDRRLRLRVERRRRLVEHDHRRVDERDARDRDELALAGREAHAARAHVGREPSGSASKRSSAPIARSASRTSSSSPPGARAARCPRSTRRRGAPPAGRRRCASAARRASRRAGRRRRSETVPCCGSYARTSSFASVDLPAPVAPTSARCSPGSTVSETSTTAGGAAAVGERHRLGARARRVAGSAPVPPTTVDRLGEQRRRSSRARRAPTGTRCTSRRAARPGRRARSGRARTRRSSRR